MSRIAPRAVQCFVRAMSDASSGKHQKGLRRAVANIHPAQFLRFAVVGGIAAMTQFSMLVGLVELAHTNKLVANAVGFVFAATANYLMNRYFTFAGTRSHMGYGMLRFAATSLVGLGINTLIFQALMSFGLWYVVAWALATGLTLIWNYSAARLIVFRG
ncbi:MAG: GtrA family protein [Proteobacteria bacterium]|nr:GtrA family protein [Pseudomonadota bacterium]